jgi:hypothetical protein
MKNCVKFLTNMSEVIAGAVILVEGHYMENIPTMSGSHLRPLISTYKHY